MIFVVMPLNLLRKQNVNSLAMQDSVKMQMPQCTRSVLYIYIWRIENSPCSKLEWQDIEDRKYNVVVIDSNVTHSTIVLCSNNYNKKTALRYLGLMLVTKISYYFSFGM